MTDRDESAPEVVRFTLAAGVTGQRHVWVDTAHIVGVQEQEDGTAVLLLVGGQIVRLAASIRAVVARRGLSWEP